MRNVDVCIIGAGPAGMVAATECAKAGASVVLLDEQPRPGGQIYRAISTQGHPMGDVLGPDYLHGSTLLQAFSEVQLDYINEATIWRVDPDRTVYWSRRGKSEKLHARRIIIATGAIERSFAFPGWTLPGVMTAGASQILLKTSGIAPKNAVMVGTGPLLYLLAGQLINAGATPAAIVDTQLPTSYLKASRYLANALFGHQYIVKGLKLLKQIKQAGIPHYTQATDIRADGGEQLEQLTFNIKGKAHTLTTSTVLSHIGVIPNVQLTRSMGIDHEWDSQQRCWKPTLDETLNTSLAGIAVAGDGCGIGGAKVAEKQGHLVAIDALHALGYLPSERWQQETQRLILAIRKELAIRPFLDTLYSPPQQAMTPEDSTIVCRCEEVTAGDIRKMARNHCNGINQVKALTRCGMGPCQGRYCGSTVAEIMAAETGKEPAQVGYYRIRHPIKPLKLSELASLAPSEKSYIQPYRKVKEQHNDNYSTKAHESAHE